MQLTLVLLGSFVHDRLTLLLTGRLCIATELVLIGGDV
jgi:hypothetical protein